MGDTTRIYYTDHVMVYGLPYQYSGSSVFVHGEEGTESDYTHSSETRYRYFVHRRGSTSGLLYASPTSKDLAERRAVDSMRRYVGIQTDLRQMIENCLAQGGVKTTLPTPSGFIERFVFNSTGEENDLDTALFHYTRNAEDLPFSLSPYLDSARGARLLKVQLGFGETYSAKHSITFPKRTIVMALERIETLDIPLLNGLLQRFERDEGSMATLPQKDW